MNVERLLERFLEGIKQLSDYTENPKCPISSSDLNRVFQYLGGVEITNSRFDTRSFLYGFS